MERILQTLEIHRNKSYKPSRKDNKKCNLPEVFTIDLRKSISSIKHTCEEKYKSYEEYNLITQAYNFSPIFDFELHIFNSAVTNRFNLTISIRTSLYYLENIYIVYKENGNKLKVNLADYYKISKLSNLQRSTDGNEFYCELGEFKNYNLDIIETKTDTEMNEEISAEEELQTLIENRHINFRIIDKDKK